MTVTNKFLNITHFYEIPIHELEKKSNGMEENKIEQLKH